MITQLETSNPHCFTYKTDELLIELLGRIRIDTLDKMRVSTTDLTLSNPGHTSGKPRTNLGPNTDQPRNNHSLSSDQPRTNHGKKTANHGTPTEKLLRLSIDGTLHGESFISITYAAYCGQSLK